MILVEKMPFVQNVESDTEIGHKGAFCNDLGRLIAERCIKSPYDFIVCKKKPDVKIQIRLIDSLLCTC